MGWSTGEEPGVLYKHQMSTYRSEVNGLPALNMEVDSLLFNEPNIRTLVLFLVEGYFHILGVYLGGIAGVGGCIWRKVGDSD